MKELYLPNLKSIKISNYTLYQQEPTFDFEFKDGINAVVGANGIGKTTFVNIIIYCLVGHKKKKNKVTKNSKKPEFEYIDEDFFSSRINNEADDVMNMSARATLEYYLGKTKILITRSLVNNSIDELCIDDEGIPQPNDSIYQEVIEKYSKISQFQDFELLVREFLFFDERRNNVAWEVDSQDNILRILLLKEQYHLKINELEEKITKADTRGRHKSEEKRVAEASYTELVKSRDDIVNQTKDGSNDEEKEVDDDETNRERLVLRKNKIDTDISNKKEMLFELQEMVEEITEDVALTEGNIANISVSYDNIVSEIKRLETMLYRSIYNKLPDYYYTIEKTLLTEGKCLVCNKKSKDIQRKASRLKQSGKCMICESELAENISFNDDWVEKLNCLHEEKKEKLNELNNLKNQLERLNSKFQNQKKEINVLKNELEDLNRTKIVVESELSQNNPESNQGDMYTEILRNKEKVIADLEIVIRDAEKSVGLTDGTDVGRETVKWYAEQILKLDEQLAVIESTLHRKCREIPYAENILAINGVGENILAGILAEMGDIGRFDDVKEIQKLSGMGLVACSSGKHKGQTKISHRGRKRLRYWLFQAGKSAVPHADEFKQLHEQSKKFSLNFFGLIEELIKEMDK